MGRLPNMSFSFAPGSLCMSFFLPSSLPSFPLIHLCSYFKTQFPCHHLWDDFPNSFRHNCTHFCYKACFEKTWLSFKMVDRRQQFEVAYVWFPQWETWSECKKWHQLNSSWVEINKMHPYTQLRSAPSVHCRCTKPHPSLMLQPSSDFSSPSFLSPPATHNSKPSVGKSKFWILR